MPSVCNSAIILFILLSTNENARHLFLTIDFEQFSIYFRQSVVIETNCTSMKQFRFYCEKLHCIRSDIVQTVVKFVSVKFVIVSNAA